ncbi:unnamed protein product, partial [Didymodactylos carnosus]
MTYIRCIVGNELFVVPQEIKSHYHCRTDRNHEGIDGNCEAFGKLLKLVLKRLNESNHKCSRLDNKDETRILCTFMSRIHCVWFIDFICKFENDEWNLSKCFVYPQFPVPDQVPIGELCSLKLIDHNDYGALEHLLPTLPTMGFKLLVQYIETLCTRYNIKKCGITFLYNNGIHKMINGKIEIIEQTRKSIILVEKDEDKKPSEASATGDNGQNSIGSIIKISKYQLIRNEMNAHKILDG